MTKAAWYERSGNLFLLLTALSISMGLMPSLSSVVAETADDISRSADARQPAFTPNGTIVSGTKSIWQKSKGWPQVLMCIDNDAMCNLFEVFNLGKADLNASYFMNIKAEMIGNSSVITSEVRDAISSEKKLGIYRLSLTLLDNGLIRVEATCRLDDPQLLKSRYCKFEIPPYLALSGAYTRKGKRTSFDGKAPLHFSGEDLKDLTVTFFPGSNNKSFSISPDGCSEVTITPHAITLHADHAGTMSFLLDIRDGDASPNASEFSPNGIDFWGISRLHLPDYGASTNLISNPSFEAGLRYWCYPLVAEGQIPLKHQDLYVLDDKQAHSGSHSLRITALRSKNPLPIGPFTVPFVPKRPYTLSFYAKGSSDQDLVVSLSSRQLKHPDLFAKESSTFAVDSQWKRYTASFVPDDRFGGIFFRAQLTSSALTQQQASVWIDDVQLEGDGLNDFTSSPLAAQLVSSARGNFLQFGHKPKFNLTIHAPPHTNGSVAIAVEDFFSRSILKLSYQFKTDKAGYGRVNLAELNDVVLNRKLRGVFTVSSAFTLEGVGRAFKDYFRFSVMDFLDNTHKNKNLFNLHYVYSLQGGGPDMERFVARERAIGFGSITYDFGSFANDLDLALDKERMELLNKYGFESMGRPVLKLHNGIGGEISEANGKVKMINIKTKTNPTDKELAKFANICALKAKKRRWNHMWWFTGESNPGCMPLEGHPEAFAKFLLATRRGVKKGNPDAKVLIEGGPWTMDPKLGGKWVERYIQDARRIDPNAEFDGAAAHHYRNFPENPDLDSDVDNFIKMLNRNGCEKWPVYVNEGGNYCPINIPQEGISPYVVNSANRWYFGPLSYHAGRPEKISAAFAARNWLVALKYQERVACMNDFMTPSRYMDVDFTPRLYDKIPNTLGRLLGNATFYKDVRFAPYVRCYVFIDDKSACPIAAIWGHKESVDRWKERPPLYAFSFGKQPLKFIDLMENEVSYPKESDGRTIIPMAPFPLFIKALPGTEQELCLAIANAVPASTPNSP